MKYSVYFIGISVKEIEQRVAFDSLTFTNGVARAFEEFGKKHVNNIVTGNSEIAKKCSNSVGSNNF